MKKLTLTLACACLAILVSCSDTSSTTEEKKSTEAPKPPEPIGGQSALFKMYQAARSVMGADVQPLQMKSIILADVKAEPGKAAAWQCMFVSAASGKARTYTYSIVESEGNLHKGVFSSTDESWSGSRGPKPFPIAAVKIETDAAYQTALKKAADYEKKNPGKPITFLLEKNEKFPDVTWRVIWGESVGTSNFSVMIDASTGDYLQTLH